MERLLSMKLIDVADSSFLADPPVRGTDYKKKGMGIDKRTMRLHRRSIDQRKMRDQTLLKQRGIDALSPLKEVQNVLKEKKVPSQAQKKAANTTGTKLQPKPQTSDMKDRLKKWKEEKDLKKKLERQKQAKPMFKVHHIQYEKAPFVTAQKNVKSQAVSKPATRVTRSSARVNKRPTNTMPAVSKPSPVAAVKPATRQSRLRQKEQPPATQKSTSTRSTRTTRNSRKSQSSSSEVKPTRSTRATRASARAAMKQKDEPVPTSSHRTQAPKKPENNEEEQHEMQTENPFFQQASVNFERGEPTLNFLQGPSFAPVNFQFDFTIHGSEFNDAPKTPDRRCSSTPLNTAKTGVTKLPTPPQGLSAIRPDNVSATVGAPINIPILSLSTSSVSSGQATNPALRSETYVVTAPTSAKTTEEFIPMDVPSEASPKLQGDDGTQKAQIIEAQPEQKSEMSSVNEEEKAPPVEMEMEESPSIEGDKAVLGSEIQATEDETKETLSTKEDNVVAESPTSTTEEEIKEVQPSIEMEMEELPSVEGDKAVLESESHTMEDDTKEEPSTNEVAEPTSSTTEEETKEAPSAECIKKDEKQDDAEAKAVAVVASEVDPSATAKTDEATKQDVAKEEEKDVPYFRNLVSSETERLTGMCDKWQGVMDASSLSEDVLGEIRSTTGKAQLLMRQRFKQFVGLVDDCEFDRGEKKTHCSDLIGFWEMVSYQVEDVDRMFADLDKLQANNWVKEVRVQKKVKKILSKKPKASAASKKAAAERVAARQRLLAAKAAMKAKATRSKENDKVVFEGGFFKVESPVRSPKVHCQAGSPLSAAFLRRTSMTPGSKPGSRQGTPRSQAFMPSNPRLSLQGALCTPISKLVLTDVNENTASPGRVTPRSRQGTPVNVVRPIVHTGTPVSNSQETNAPTTPQARTPVTRKHYRESVTHPLIPGIASPHMTTNNSNLISDASSIFTPPLQMTPTTPSSTNAVNDLICLDSPLAPTAAPPLPLQAPTQETTGSMKCFAAINASADMMDLLGTDVVMSPVRRSSRLRHTSGQMVVDKLADMPEEMDYGYQPNVSLL